MDYKTKTLEYKRQLAKRNLLTPQETLKGNTLRDIDEFQVYELLNAALIMAEYLNEIHRIASTSYDDPQGTVDEIMEVLKTIPRNRL